MKVLVLFNPYSSKQKISKNKELVINELSKSFDTVDFFESTAPKSITEYIINRGSEYDRLLVSGGDGTLNEAINGIVKGGLDIPLSYIPSGTVNDVGSILGFKKKIKKGLEIALTGKEYKIDICSLNDHNFAYVCAAGKYTAISYDVDYKLKKRLGRLAYIVRGIKEIPKKGGRIIEVTHDGITEEINCFIFFALNYRQFGGFRFFRKNKTSMQDGIIDFTFIKKRKHFNLIRTINFILFGDHVKHNVKTIQASELKIKSEEPINFNVDGELAASCNEATISVLKQRVTLIIPEKRINKLNKEAIGKEKKSK